MAKIRRETVERITKGTVAMEAGEERQVGLPLTKHVGVVADRVVSERAGQTCQHHMLTPQLLAQLTSQLQVLFDVVAVGSKHNQLTITD